MGMGTGQHAMGAFLTLRLVDQFAEHDLASEGTGYQLIATREFLAALYPQTEEVEHLLAIVNTAEAVGNSGDKGLLSQPLLQYADLLEGLDHLEESLDVLDTTIQLQCGSEDENSVAAQLRRGCVLLRTPWIAEADEAFETACAAGSGGPKYRAQAANSLRLSEHSRR